VVRAMGVTVWHGHGMEQSEGGRASVRKVTPTLQDLLRDQPAFPMASLVPQTHTYGRSKRRSRFSTGSADGRPTLEDGSGHRHAHVA